MHLNRAILVDDEVFTRKGLLKLIDWEACGFQIVDEADNGEDALELIERLQPDVVITDIRMPVLDGLELIRRVVTQDIVKPYFIIVSGYDDFNYAQQAVRYGVHDFILKPIDELEFSNALVRLSGRLESDREARLREERLLSGALMESLIIGEADEALLQEWERRLELLPEDRLFYVFVERNDLPLSKDEGEAGGGEFKDRVEEALLAVTNGAQPFYLHEHRNRIGIIVPGSILQSSQDCQREFARRIQQSLVTDNDRIFVYFGQPVQQLSLIQNAYETAKEALLYKYVYDESGIVIHEEAALHALQYIGLEESLYELLLEQIEELHFDKLEETITLLFQSFQAKLYVPEAVKMAINQCVLGVVRVLSSMEGDQSRLSSLEPMTEWHDRNLSLGELKRLFTDFAVESANYISHLRKEQHKGGIQKIRAYIEANFHENISLKSIAGKFYMNPVYLGQLFKKAYGVYFNDFLLQLRVNEAKRLLRQTDLRIYEVAERVGFGNPDYFVTQFEKIERMTPSEYRSRLMKEAASEGTNR
ncbi:response regulator transcription factor [Paenibacillus glucanolyticus]|uniref:response regulator transcription factor n=1 Tax=Paenibacillus glucanolyticus TaxID=59843 RepID=UPI00096D2FC8|nr:response regulator transcription factor [Paenibacillus glucanolyticus]OMF69092.1 DNA-binding response regulator [Paenibacillus glucanolyticus]